MSGNHNSGRKPNPDKVLEMPLPGVQPQRIMSPPLFSDKRALVVYRQIAKLLYQRGLWRAEFAVATAMLAALWTDFCDYRTVEDVQGQIKVVRALRPLLADMGLTAASMSRLAAPSPSKAEAEAVAEVAEIWDADLLV
jgi:hypothetical protein